MKKSNSRNVTWGKFHVWRSPCISFVVSNWLMTSCIHFGRKFCLFRKLKANGKKCFSSVPALLFLVPSYLVFSPEARYSPGLGSVRMKRKLKWVLRGRTERRKKAKLMRRLLGILPLETVKTRKDSLGIVNVRNSTRIIHETV